MTLRLVLVSLVVALGMTIPGAPMLESWVASTQNWMNARFADWDTRNPHDADYVIVSHRTDTGRFAPAQVTPPAANTIVATATAPAPPEGAAHEASVRVARRPTAGRSAPVNESFRVAIRPASLVRKAGAHHPAVVARVSCWEYERDQNSTRPDLGVKPPIVRRPEKPRAHLDLVAAGVRCRDIALKAVSEKLAGLPVRQPVATPPPAPKKALDPLRICSAILGGSARRPAAAAAAVAREIITASPAAAPVEKVASGPATTPTPAPGTPGPIAAVPPIATKPKSSLPSFAGMEKGQSLYFAGHLATIAGDASRAVESEPAKVVAASVVADRAESPKLEASQAPVDTAPKVVVAVAVMPATKTASLPSPGAKIGTEGAGRNELEPELDGLLADGGDGFGSAADRSPAVATASVEVSTAAASPPTDLNRAVRLTREAMYAWVNVFTGPAVVTVSQSRTATAR
ncbi:hypothetical protein OJF2_19810 [Aquisphaera giovannonii]|uniref:Uncharacterized protein n=1 Tax=Aquisphaera giovannonii TaxID=406548 RepID=A0A5B9VZR3_9BACT|nr:hypothetical protein [Aquisphaera giovannonii]QEH33479.1 hypothetical protein OJF2_19810 [Aquisphaera giovannonii]